MQVRSSLSRQAGGIKLKTSLMRSRCGFLSILLTSVCVRESDLFFLSLSPSPVSLLDPHAHEEQKPFPGTDALRFAAWLHASQVNHNWLNGANIHWSWKLLQRHRASIAREMPADDQEAVFQEVPADLLAHTSMPAHMHVRTCRLACLCVCVSALAWIHGCMHKYLCILHAGP